MNILKMINGKKTYLFTILGAFFVVIDFLVKGDYSLPSIMNLLADGSIAAVVASLRHAIAKTSVPQITVASSGTTISNAASVTLTVLLVLLAGNCFADNINVPDVFGKIPNLKQGIAYDIQGKGVDYFTTAEIANYKGFSLSGGYSTESKIVASIDYDIGGLQKLGINVPLLNVIDLRVGFYVGMGNISTSNGEQRNKVAYGPEATFVSLKF